MKESIGALWKKQGSKGEFFSGSITVGDNKLDIVVFSNDKGDNPKRPDYKIFISEPKEAPF